MSANAWLKPCPFCACAMRIEPVGRDWWRLHGDHQAWCMFRSCETDVPQTTEQRVALERDWNRRELPQDQRLDLATAAFTIAARNDPACVLQELDAERILDLLAELAGMDLDAAVGAAHGQPT